MRSAVALACLFALAACAHSGAWRDDGISLPRAPAAGERVFLEVTVGVLGSGQEVTLRTRDGALIGTVSPHGIRPGHAAGTYAVPVPPALLPSLLENGRLHIRAFIERAGAEPRTAGPDEVKQIHALVASQ